MSHLRLAPNYGTTTEDPMNQAAIKTQESPQVPNFFSFAAGGKEPVQVEVREVNGEILFRAGDVAECLAMRTPDMVRMVDDEDVRKLHTLTSGGNQEVSFITEGGLYTVLVRSNKPEAKPFRRWVTHEVLPSIRKTGSYSVSVPALPNFLDPAEAAIAWATE